MNFPLARVRVQLITIQHVSAQHLIPVPRAIHNTNIASWSSVGHLAFSRAYNVESKSQGWLWEAPNSRRWSQRVVGNMHRRAPTWLMGSVRSMAEKADFPEVKEDEKKKKSSGDPRIDDLGRAIEDDFATIRENYATPRNPIVLAHGLMGFDELRLAGSLFPGVHYWRGITEALQANGCEVITASVPASGSIEERAAKLGQDIAAKANGKSVNIIAHSMGGLDSRYMISQLQPENVRVLSLTTVASPHRGSAFADYCFEIVGPRHLPYLYKLVEATGLGTGAFSQLTRKYMAENFNPKTPDDPTVRYFSYGAVAHPGIFSAFRQPHRIMNKMEGPNDGLVSVESARWGTYKGTLVGVSHLDLINWTNRLRWLIWKWTGHERHFNAIAFYLDIADMLEKEGL